VVFGSVCSGIEAASVAWEPLGYRCAFLSEIAKFPRAVLSHRFSDVPLRGDFTEIREGEHEPIDVLVGGTPCQSFSVAGLRRGLADERGNLAVKYLRLAARLGPRWTVWENVPGALSSDEGRAFGAFLGGLAELGYGFAYRVLDAQFFGVPQRRRRVFVVGCLGDWRRAAAVLFEPEGMSRDPAPGREAGEGAPGGVANCLRGHGHDASEDGTRGNLIAPARCLTGHASRYDAESETLIADLVQATSPTSPTSRTQPKPVCPPLMTTSQPIAFNARQDPVSGAVVGALDVDAHTHAVSGGGGVRRLTPRERERLQGFPDDWTRIPYRGGMAKDGPRCQAIGNSMAVPVMRWIGRRLMTAHEQGEG